MSKRQSAAAKAKAEAAATETQAAAVTEGDTGSPDAIQSDPASDPSPEVPAVTVAAKAKAEITADPEPGEEVVLTVENCTHFQNKQGRIFPATEVLRRLARRQDLKPVAAPK